MATLTHINPAGLIRSPAFSQAVRVPAGSDLIYVGGQNGVDEHGELVGAGLAEQTRRAMGNLRACLAEAGAGPADIVKWTVLAVAGTDPAEGFAAAFEGWPADATPPAITVAFVEGLAVPGALVEIEAVAAVPAR